MCSCKSSISERIEIKIENLEGYSIYHRNNQPLKMLLTDGLEFWRIPDPPVGVLCYSSSSALLMLFQRGEAADPKPVLTTF